MIFDELRREWDDGHRRLDTDAPQLAAERWWLWHDRARALTHALYADHGWQALTDGPTGDTDLPGIAVIEGFTAHEAPGDEQALAGAQAGIAAALTDIRTTLTHAFATLPRPLQPVWSGPIPLPPED